MKKAIFLAMAFIVCLGTVTTAQPWTTGQPTAQTFGHPLYYPSPYTIAGQMIRVDNPYAYEQFNVKPFIAYSFLDTTSTGTSTMYLYISTNGKYVSPAVTPRALADTFVPYPIYATGSLEIAAFFIKVSGTPAGSITIEESNNGYSWAPVHLSDARVVSSVNTGTVTAYNSLSAPDSMQIANVATVQKYAWHFPIKYDFFYRANISTTGTETGTVQMFYAFNYNNQH